jgi:preprotein translocase subunit SecG
MAFSQLRPLSLGEVLDGAFTLYRRQFSSMFLTALIPQIPMIAFMALYYGMLAQPGVAGGSGPSATTLVATLVLLPVALVGTLAGFGGVTFQVARAYTGAPVTTGEAIRRGLSRALPLLGAYMLVGILSMFGLIAFIIGALFVWISAFAVAPAVVLERRGPIDAISRSWALIKGAWGEVFLVMFIAYLIAALPGFAVSMFATLGAALISHGDMSKMMGAQAVGQVLAQITQTLTIPFSAGALVLLYYDRRVRSEALDVQMMAESLAAAPPPPQPVPGWG